MSRFENAPLLPARGSSDIRFRKRHLAGSAGAKELYMPVIRWSLVVLAVAAFPAVALAHETNMPTPPSGYDTERSGIAHGMVMSTMYPAGSYGMKNMRVYLPPGYSTARKYPVLYLHHGLGGTEAGWTDHNLRAHIVVDNLVADGMAVPMIIVMPNSFRP
jgi:hypothetical protein